MASMMTGRVGLLLAAAAAALVQCTEGRSHISGSELSQKLAEIESAVVAFVSVKINEQSSDPRSQKLERQWDTVESESKIPFFSIDCLQSPDTCAIYGITPRPAIKVVHKSEIVADYQGPFRSEKILQFVERVSRPVVSTVEKHSLDAFRLIDDVVFIAYLKENDEKSAEAFRNVAQKYRSEFTFGIVTDSEAAEEDDVSTPLVRCYRPVDDVVETFGFENEKSLNSFVIESSRHVISELTLRNHQRLLDRGWPMVYLFAETHEERMFLADELRSFTKGHYSSLTCTLVDPAEFPDLPARLGLERGRYPAGSVHQLSKNRIFPYPRGRSISPKHLQAWGLEVWQGRIKPWTPPSDKAEEQQKKKKKKKKKTKDKKDKKGTQKKKKTTGNKEDGIPGFGFRNAAGIGIKLGERDEL